MTLHMLQKAVPHRRDSLFSCCDGYIVYGEEIRMGQRGCVYADTVKANDANKEVSRKRKQAKWRKATGTAVGVLGAFFDGLCGQRGVS